MEILRRAAGDTRRLAVFPGSFNPPTAGHVALAQAAVSVADEVLFVLPRVFPHKQYEGATFEQRLQLLMALSGLDRRFSAAVSDGGLFIDIARECRPHYPPDTDLLFLCGRDAAERIVGWDYGDPGAFGRMLGEFRLLVARRGAQYLPPSKYAGRIEALPIAGSWDEVSATEVRDRVSRGDNWRHLVPEALAPLIEEIYSN